MEGREKDGEEEGERAVEDHCRGFILGGGGGEGGGDLGNAVDGDRDEEGGGEEGDWGMLVEAAMQWG